MSDKPGKKALTVLGIWMGSPAKFPPLRQEGIFRFLLNLVHHLARRDSLRIEIWCQQLNLPRVRELFAPLLDQPELRQRIVFCTEFTESLQHGTALRPRVVRLAAGLSHLTRTTVFAIKDVLFLYRRTAVLALGVPSLVGLALLVGIVARGRAPWVILIAIVCLALLAIGRRAVIPAAEALAFRLWEGFKHSGNFLPQVANSRSAADCFLVQNLDLATVVELERPKVVCLHDLYTSEYASLFGRSGRGQRVRSQGQRAVQAAERLARNGALFVSNSDHIRRTHGLGLIKGLTEEQTAVVPLPGPIPTGIRKRLPEPDAVLGRFGIPRPYLFYATHFRPYKNVLTLLKALAIARSESRIHLVLTARLAADPECAVFAETNHLTDCVISTGELSDTELFTLYRSAALVAVPTLSEGGFPWQALEAMAMDVPVIVSRIPVVLERLAYHGFTPETCGLRLFEPTDARALARSIVDVLANRDEVLREQGAVRQALLSYGWEDVARQYHEILEAAVRRGSHV